MAAGTDYGIFFFGRYQEVRQAGEDLKTAYYTTYRGVAPVVLGSGLTIAGAMLCLSFTRMPIFQTIGVPCAVGMLVAVAVAITLVPAVLAVGSRFGLFDPTRRIAVTSMAMDRHSDCPLARAHSRHDISGRADRSGDTAGLQNELQRPPLYTQRYSGQFGVCGRRSSFLPIANDARNSDDRIKS